MYQLDVQCSNVNKMKMTFGLHNNIDIILYKHLKMVFWVDYQLVISC